MFYSYSWFHDTECTSWEKIGADQLRIHLYVFSILNRLKVNSSDGLQMRKQRYVSLFSPLKLTDADLQRVRAALSKKEIQLEVVHTIVVHSVNDQIDKTLDPFVNATDIDHDKISNRVYKTSKLPHHFN